MKKGEIPVPQLVALILAVIVIAVLAYVISKSGSWGLDTIPKMIEQWFGTTSPEEKTLIKAMTCAYYRCAEGCSSKLVRNAIWEDENGEKVSCLDNFCKDEWRDSEGKICGDVAKENPVKITLDADVEVTRDMSATFFKQAMEHLNINIMAEDYSFILEKSSCKRPFAGRTYFTLVVPDDKDVECTQERTALTPKSCILPQGDYYLWSSKGAIFELSSVSPDVTICSSNDITSGMSSSDESSTPISEYNGP